MSKYKITIAYLKGNEEDIIIEADSYLLHYKETKTRDMEFLGSGFNVQELGETLKATIDFVVNECID